MAGPALIPVPVTVTAYERHQLVPRGYLALLDDTWLVFNGRKPLYGHLTWGGHNLASGGQFYAAVALNTVDSHDHIRQTVDRGGRMLAFDDQPDMLYTDGVRLYAHEGERV